MKWNEIVTEGSDYNCPNCDEYLGKASEVIANNNEYCGNCGWSADDDKPKKPAAKPTPAPKPLPKSKQTLVKTAGDFEIRIYPGRTSAGIYYTGQKTQAVSNMDWSGFDAFGGVQKQANGSWTGERYGRYGGRKNVGSFDTMTKAANAVKASFKAELKRMSPKKVKEAAGDPMILGRTVPNWNNPEEQGDSAHFTDDSGHHTMEVLFRNGAYIAWHSQDDVKRFRKPEQVEAYLEERDFKIYVGVEHFTPEKPLSVD